MAYYLGIDVGTSSVKLTCVNEFGDVVASSSEAYDSESPKPGWREIDPEVWWSSVRLASERLSDAIDFSRIGGVGVTGQMHTVVLVDAEGAPVAPAIMWNDQRTVDEVAPQKEWAVSAGIPWLSKLIATGIPAMNLYWTGKNRPADIKKASAFIGVPDWIALKLGGHIGIDYCGASTSGLFDNESLSWSSMVCEHFGIPETLLPPIEKADAVAGCVTADASNQTGIPQGAAIVRGTGDNPAAAICTGCLLEEMPTISIGTSGVLMHAADGVVFPGAGKPVLFAWGNRLKTLTQLSVRSCGGAKEWLYGNILRTDSYDIEDECVEDPLYDMRTLMFYPHLAGEKVLHGDPTVRGAFFGLDLGTTRSELQRALMEGTAFALRSLKEAVEESDSWGAIRLVGGGAKNAFWSRALCNIMGVPIIRAKTTGAGHGVALLALSAATGESIDEIAPQACELLDTLVPDEHIHMIYDQRFERYERIYDALKVVYSD